MNGSDGMFKYEEIVLERVSTPYSATSSLLPLSHPRHSWPPTHPAQLMGRERLVSAPRSLWRLSWVLHLLCQPGSHQDGLAALLSPCTPLQKGGRRASPSFTPSPPQTHQCRTWGEALCHCLCQKTGVWGALLVQTQMSAPHNWAQGPEPPCHQAPHHSGAHSLGMLSCKNRLFSKTNHNAGSSC